jgi:hypothetical protein
LVLENQITINEEILTKKIKDNLIISINCTNKIEHPKLKLCKNCTILRKKLIYYSNSIEKTIKGINLQKNLKIKNYKLLKIQNEFLKKKLKEKNTLNLNKKNIEKNLNNIEDNQKLEFINLFIPLIKNGFKEKNSFFYKYLENVFNNLDKSRNNNNHWDDIVNFGKVLK